MIEYEVYVTEKANEDLKSIYDYISNNLFEANISEKIIKNIDDSISKLSYMPKKFSIVNNNFFANKGLRKFKVSNYIIFYIVNDEKKAVFIIRILYGKRNWEKLI